MNFRSPDSLEEAFTFVTVYDLFGVRLCVHSFTFKFHFIMIETYEKFEKPGNLINYFD